jgi:ABC-type nickel/cobalt efflux system permease component RcnA
MNWIFWLCAFLIVINIVVTVSIAFSRVYDTQQKLLQIALIWIIPVIGAIVCWNILREERRSEHPSKAAGERVDAGDDYSASGNYDRGNNHSHHGDGGGHNGGSGH